MRTRNPVAAPRRTVQRPPAFDTPNEITVGMVAFDRDHEMPGTVRNVDGLFIEMERPTGLVWRVNFRRLRRATEWECRQLVAVGRLHRQRQRGRA
jgi:hypothetical protein